MARPKEFDREEALDRAVELFWRRGYEATSMNDLVEHLAIGRQSLYDTFGDKHALYLAAITRYRQRHAGWFHGVLDAPVPVRRALANLFDTLIAEQCGDVDHKGCFLVNAAMELGAGDREVRRSISIDREALERAIEVRLVAAQEAGEIAPHLSPLSLARFFAAIVHGLVVTAKMTRNRSAVEDAARVAVSILG